MKNRKFIHKDGLECIGWDIQTYTSKLFDTTAPQFWAEFTYTNGYHQISFDIESASVMAKELTKFVIEATKKEEEFKNKYKKKGKK